jgi:hypothetical protein
MAMNLKYVNFMISIVFLKIRSATLMHTSELYMRHATKTKSGVEAELRSFLIAALDGG